MKLSQMTLDQSCDCLVKITPCLSNIIEDENVKNLMEDWAKMQKEPLYKTIGKLLPQVTTLAAVKHRKDLYAIVGAITLKPEKEVGKMTLVQVMKELKESIDEDFIGFFRSSGGATAEPGKE